VCKINVLMQTRNRHSAESKGSAFVWYSTCIEAARAILSLHSRYTFPDAKGDHVRLVTVRPAVKAPKPQATHMFGYDVRKQGHLSYSALSPQATSMQQQLSWMYHQQSGAGMHGAPGMPVDASGHLSAMDPCRSGDGSTPRQQKPSNRGQLPGYGGVAQASAPLALPWIGTQSMQPGHAQGCSASWQPGVQALQMPGSAAGGGGGGLGNYGAAGAAGGTDHAFLLQAMANMHIAMSGAPDEAAHGGVPRPMPQMARGSTSGSGHSTSGHFDLPAPGFSSSELGVKTWQ
jgi:hypothetical protein